MSWLRLWNGTREVLGDGTACTVYYSSNAAASKLGIYKRTLEDYYIHLRFAQDKKYDLAKDASKSLGLLRQFKRNFKKK